MQPPEKKQEKPDISCLIQYQISKNIPNFNLNPPIYSPTPIFSNIYTPTLQNIPNIPPPEIRTPSPMQIPKLMATVTDINDPQKWTPKPQKSTEIKHKCTKCNRTYLSYPALYTHIKIKHSETEPMKYQEKSLGSMKEELKTSKSLKTKEKSEKLKEFTNWFTFKGREGVTTDLTIGFQDNLKILNLNYIYPDFTKHPIYAELCKFQTSPTSTEKLSEKKSGLDDLIEKHQKNCDEIFAEYLKNIAKITNPDYYKIVMQFIILYRECMNNQREKLENEKQKLEEILIYKKKSSDMGTDFCQNNNADQIPDLANYFITNYLSENYPFFNIEEAKGLIIDFCSWLFHNHYSCSSITLLS